MAEVARDTERGREQRNQIDTQGHDWETERQISVEMEELSPDRKQGAE